MVKNEVSGEDFLSIAFDFLFSGKEMVEGVL